MQTSEVLNEGARGATVQSWRGANPRELLREVIAQLPSASEEELFDALVSRIEKEDAVSIGRSSYLRVCLEYWFTNNHKSIMRPLPRGDEFARNKRRVAAAIQATKATVVKRIVERIALLDWELPSGKSLRDATGKECAKAGGWLTKVAAKVKPNEKVGAVLNEKQLRAIFEGK